MEKQATIARKYFGNDIPPLHEIEANVSLIFMNQQSPISYVGPSVPNVIPIGGFHVSTQVQTLNEVFSNEWFHFNPEQWYAVVLLSLFSAGSTENLGRSNTGFRLHESWVKRKEQNAV